MFPFLRVYTYIQGASSLMTAYKHWRIFTFSYQSHYLAALIRKNSIFEDCKIYLRSMKTHCITKLLHSGTYLFTKNIDRCCRSMSDLKWIQMILKVSEINTMACQITLQIDLFSFCNGNYLKDRGSNPGMQICLLLLRYFKSIKNLRYIGKLSTNIRTEITLFYTAWKPLKKY